MHRCNLFTKDFIQHEKSNIITCFARKKRIVFITFPIFCYVHSCIAMVMDFPLLFRMKCAIIHPVSTSKIRAKTSFFFIDVRL